MKKTLTIILFIIAFFATACEPLPDDELPTLAVITPNEAVTITPPVVVEQNPLPTGTPLPAPINRDDPLRFTFPTPATELVSAWRPPLYEVPWALGPYDHFLFLRPIAVDQVNWPLPTYRYGYQIGDSNATHSGIDIDAKFGTPVLAAAPGVVTHAGYGVFSGINDPEDPYGLAIAIRHDFGYQGQKLYTIYGHLDRVDVIKGQRVAAGEAIGLLGNTGRSTGPHLHFEVRLQKTTFLATYNPELWIAPPQGWGILVGRFEAEEGGLLINQEVIVRGKINSSYRTAMTYGKAGYNSDPYYQENLVLADLPAGEYQVSITIEDNQYKAIIRINPGAITYLHFKAGLGFTDQQPRGITDPGWMLSVDP